METRQKVEQVQTYPSPSAMQNPKNLHHDAVQEEKECRLGRGESQIGQAELSSELKHIKD